MSTSPQRLGKRSGGEVRGASFSRMVVAFFSSASAVAMEAAWSSILPLATSASLESSAILAWRPQHHHKAEDGCMESDGRLRHMYRSVCFSAPSAARNRRMSERGKARS